MPDRMTGQARIRSGPAASSLRGDLSAEELRIHLSETRSRDPGQDAQLLRQLGVRRRACCMASANHRSEYSLLA
jgi:hypothetical protein